MRGGIGCCGARVIGKSDGVNQRTDAGKGRKLYFPNRLKAIGNFWEADGHNLLDEISTRSALSDLILAHICSVENR